MKNLRLTIIICLILLPAVSRAADDGYGYPIADSCEATIVGTPDSLKSELPAVFPVKQLLVDIIPNMKKPDVFFTTRACAAPWPTRIIKRHSSS